MGRLHKDLEKKYKWYKNWHRIPNVSYVHFSLFIAAAVLTANYAQYTAMVIDSETNTEIAVAIESMTANTHGAMRVQSRATEFTLGAAVRAASNSSVREEPT